MCATLSVVHFGSFRFHGNCGVKDDHRTNPLEFLGVRLYTRHVTREDPPRCLPRVKVHAQCSEQRPRHGRGEPALIIQLARDGQHGPGACDSQGRPGESRPARMRRARRKVWLRQTPIWRLEERQRRGRPPEARCGSTTSWTRPSADPTAGRAAPAATGRRLFSVSKELAEKPVDPRRRRDGFIRANS